MSDQSTSTGRQADQSRHQAGFVRLSRRFASLLRGRRSDDEGFRAARAYAAIAVERYAECAHEGLDGFSKRIWAVVRGPDTSLGRLRRTDPDIAEEQDQASLRPWILVLRKLAVEHRMEGLPGLNVIGGGRTGGRRRRDEFGIKGVYYSPLRWRQLAEDSAAACMVLSDMARCELAPVNTEVPRASGTERDRAASTVRLPLEPSLPMSRLVFELKQRKAVITDRTVRRWFQRWRQKTGMAAHPEGQIPLAHVAALASWLETSQSTCKETVPLLREIVASRMGGQVADR